MPDQRHIKLQEKHYRDKIVPELKLSGLWLEKVGFMAGQTVTVTIRKEQLIIEPEQSWK